MARQKRIYGVTRITVELMESIYARLESYSKEFGWSKRRLIEDALVCWLNQRDMEKEQREK